MCLICVSYTRELNVSRFSKEVKITGKHRRIAAQIPSYDDIQSNTTYMERLSDMVRFFLMKITECFTGIFDMTKINKISVFMRFCEFPFFHNLRYSYILIFTTYIYSEL